jgi:hypothetical protein
LTSSQRIFINLRRQELVGGRKGLWAVFVNPLIRLADVLDDIFAYNTVICNSETDPAKLVIYLKGNSNDWGFFLRDAGDGIKDGERATVRIITVGGADIANDVRVDSVREPRSFSLLGHASC